MKKPIVDDRDVRVYPDTDKRLKSRPQKTKLQLVITVCYESALCDSDRRGAVKALDYAAAYLAGTGLLREGIDVCLEDWSHKVEVLS